MRKLLSVLAGLLLCILFSAACASGTVKVSVTGGMGVYSISREAYIRSSDGVPDSLGGDEYISFMVDVTNTGKTDQKYSNVYFRVDGGDKLGLAGFTLKAGQTARCHVFHVNMKKLSAGTHLVDFYINGQIVFSHRFHLSRNWLSVMSYPGSAQKEAVRGRKRSPYIVYYPQFKGVEGITEYAIDFWIDDMDKGTYFSTMNCDMDISALTGKYSSVTNDFNTPGAFYCGVQCWDDGRTGVIMSVWDNICRDKNGNTTIVCADQVYPEYRKGKSRTSGEGRFQQFLQEYPISTRHPYRMLIQMSQSKSTGNSELAMWICDLESMEWTELVKWDLGYSSRFMKTKYLAGFMENYLTQYTGSVRNVSFSNIRGKNYKTGKWVGVKSVVYTVNNSITDLGYMGSYNFGSDDSTFWIITSGVEGLCRLPKSGSEFSVKNVSTGQPY